MAIRVRVKITQMISVVLSGVRRFRPEEDGDGGSIGRYASVLLEVGARRGRESETGPSASLSEDG